MTHVGEKQQGDGWAVDGSSFGVRWPDTALWFCTWNAIKPVQYLNRLA